MSWIITPQQRYPTDPDASDYILRVEAADGQALEASVKNLINNLFVGVKDDGIFAALKACCILAAARTIPGALTPLLSSMPVPTNVGFVAGDYDRKTGLGDPLNTTKYLNSNRNNNADPQNNNHNACWVSIPAAGVLMASSSALSGQNYLDITTLPNTRFYSRTNTGLQAVAGAASAGFYGHRRSNSTSYVGTCPQGTQTFNAASQPTDTRPVFIYIRSDDGVTFSSSSPARIAFYSIGESLNLTLLRDRVSTFMSSLAALSL